MKNFFLLLTAICAVNLMYAQTPKNLTLLDTLSFPGGMGLSGCWHYNDSTGNEYALIGATDGIVIADITNPTNIIKLLQLPGVTSNWHEIKVNGDYAYAVSEGTDPNGINNGLQIIDLRFLPDSAPYVFYQGDDIIANQLETSHSVTTASHYVYLNGHNIFALGRGVLILDIINPMAPVFVGAITDRYCHDSYVRGDIIYTSDIYDGMFSVYDISDPANPVLKATQSTPGQFNHNTWLSDDSQTIFTVDESPNTPLASYDISNLNNITLLDTFYNDNFSNNEVHNVRVLNDFLINPSYGSQLTLVDAAHPDNLIEIGNYETGSGLCWDADPYTNSGNIIATDGPTMYLFAPNYIRACYLEGTITDSVTNLPIFDATVQIQVPQIFESSDISGEYKTGCADSGLYNVIYSKTGYNSKQLTVSLQNGVLITQDVLLVPENVSVNEVATAEFSVYPNPVSDELSVVSFQNKKIYDWQIFDFSGRIVMKNDAKFFKGSNFSIDVSSLPGGNYSIKFNSEIGSTALPFLKN